MGKRGHRVEKRRERSKKKRDSGDRRVYRAERCERENRMRF